MSNAILRKCLEELKQEAPRKDYVIGMLETLIELGETSPGITLKPVPMPGVDSQPLSKDDEAALLDAKARAALATVKSMTNLQ